VLRADARERLWTQGAISQTHEIVEEGLAWVASRREAARFSIAPSRRAAPLGDG